jgi:hypothetical protein
VCVEGRSKIACVSSRKIKDTRHRDNQRHLALEHQTSFEDLSALSRRRVASWLPVSSSIIARFDSVAIVSVRYTHMCTLTAYSQPQAQAQAQAQTDANIYISGMVSQRETQM